MISIIVPTYNRAHLIIETLQSIERQTYQNWECIIVDDHSTDSTSDQVKLFINKNDKFKFFKRPIHKSKGANACRNYGITLAEGKFVKFLDSDDLLLDDCLEVQYKFLQVDKELDMVCGYARFFNKDLSNYWVVKPEIMDAENSLLNYVTSKLFFHTAGPLWKFTFLKKQIQLFNEELHRLQDTEFHYRMLLNGVKFKFINVPIVYYRRDSIDSISRNNDIRNFNSIFKYYELVFYTFRHSNPLILEKTRRLFAKKVSLLSHKMIGVNSNILMRWSTVKLIYSRLFLILNDLNLSYLTKVKIFIGIIMTLMTRRGLKYFRI
ncbi:glycosyltransferase family 2 protein [Winogradskyella sp.]|uniref:glycosyltransferase family 2 protein n=1 Tax=Winogradskyella sp. TaxID=1883156 RepID=UPI003704215F